MEGAVYSLIPGELVAKVWFHRGADTLRRLAGFYDRLSRANHSLRTPKIHRIDTVDGVAITTEAFLPGTPLDQHLVSTAKQPEPQAVDALVEVLSTLQSIGRASEFRQVFLLDDSLEPMSMLDFGFLSTLGDPAFDASITSAIFEMYGPHARELDEQLTTTMQRAFGYDRDTCLSYRAVYALLTSNAYSPDGSDGHFRWCVELLGRQDVRDALGM